MAVSTINLSGLRYKDVNIKYSDISNPSTQDNVMHYAAVLLSTFFGTLPIKDVSVINWTLKMSWAQLDSNGSKICIYYWGAMPDNWQITLRGFY